MPNTFSELIDLILILLYELKKRKKQDYYGLKSMMKAVNYPYSYGDIYQMAKYLETAGYVNSYIVIGDAFLEITTMGVIEIERKIPTMPSYKEFLEGVEKHNLFNKIDLLTDESQMAARKEILEKVKEVDKKLHERFGDTADVYYDIQVLIVELTKLRPNKDIILTKLFSLRDYPAIRFELKQLSEMLDIDTFKR